MKVKISSVKIPKLYCRTEVDSDTVFLYMQNIDNLPPIEINRSNKLINGRHRLQAHKNLGLEEIEVIVRDVSDKEIFIKSIETNRKQGKQLTSYDRRHSANELYKQDITDLKEISKILSVSYETVVKWTAKLRNEIKEERDKKVIKLSEQGKTQEEIAEEFCIERSRVSQIVNDSKNTKTNNTGIYEGEDSWIKTSDNIVDVPEKETVEEDVGVHIDNGFIVCNGCKARFKLVKILVDGELKSHRLIKM